MSSRPMSRAMKNCARPDISRRCHASAEDLNSPRFWETVRVQGGPTPTANAFDFDDDASGSRTGWSTSLAVLSVHEVREDRRY
jgi:hypothetical protein